MVEQSAELYFVPYKDLVTSRARSASNNLAWEGVLTSFFHTIKGHLL